MLKCSIIIPVYNVARYLSDCLDSVCSQNVDSDFFEIIVVDDCSPDTEKIIVDLYRKKYHNIRYVRHAENKRQGGARNTGINLAKGEYVMFLDGDDFLVYKNTLSILFDLIDKYSPVILRSGTCQSFSQEAKSMCCREYIGVNQINHSTCDFKEWRLSDNFGCSVWGTLYKKTFLLNNNLFFRENVLYEDTDWTQITMYHAKDIDIIDFAFYGYRNSSDSTTRGKSIAAYEGNVQGVIEAFKFYRKECFYDEYFREELYSRFSKTVVGLLKISRYYPVSEGYKMVKLLNESGLTTIRSNKAFNNVLLIMMRYTPWIPIMIFKISFLLRHVFRCNV